MRLWSVHPKYLDAKGLVALWREALLAKKALAGQTTGYTNHPQLQRFKDAEDSMVAIDTYLFYVFEEAEKRGYKFDKNKLGEVLTESKIAVTQGQVNYEVEHLKDKLKARDEKAYARLLKVTKIKLHPILVSVPGDVESWERF